MAGKETPRKDLIAVLKAIQAAGPGLPAMRSASEAKNRMGYINAILML